MPSGRHHLWRPFPPPSAGGGRHPPNCAALGVPADSTMSHRETPAPSRDGAASSGSDGRAAFFSQVLRIWTGDPVLGALPAHAQALEGLADRLVADLQGAEALGETHLGGPRQGPETARLAKLARAAVQEGP